LLVVWFTISAAAQPVLKVRPKPAIDSSNVEFPLERYVAAVVAAESGSFRSDEALKAMAVAARSYGLHFRGRHAREGYDLCGTTHCQRVEPTLVTPRIEAAVAATAGEIAWYEGKPIFASYSRDCGGVTEDVAAVWSDLSLPFLRSHPDPYCMRASASAWHWTATPAQVADVLRRSELRVPVEMAGLRIARKTESGRARELLLTGGSEPVRLAASSFRFAIGRALGFNTIRSDRWEPMLRGDRIEFRGFGEGHGVGLCQKGAEQMGLEGRSYREILAFYFPGTSVGTSARGLSWTRLAGETVALFSTRIDQDRVVLVLAEQQVREVAAQIGLPAPAGIEIRAYPDLDSFRNATGEPGWVAARTKETRIELQPVAILRSKGVLDSTLRHEIVHTFLETQTAPGVPVWFREGLAAYLSGTRAGPGVESDVQRRDDESRARSANAAAAARVGDLVKRHGLPLVISWLKTGVPKM
jgi:stage II sporulation protein D